MSKEHYLVQQIEKMRIDLNKLITKYAKPILDKKLSSDEIENITHELIPEFLMFVTNFLNVQERTELRGLVNKSRKAKVKKK